MEEGNLAVAASPPLRPAAARSGLRPGSVPGASPQAGIGRAAGPLSWALASVVLLGELGFVVGLEFVGLVKV